MPFVKRVIFDMDGTLVNSMPTYTGAFADVMGKRGVPRDEAGSFLINSAGTPLQQQFYALIGKHDIKADIDECTAEFWEIVKRSTPVAFADTESVVRTLRNQDRRLYITTGTKTEEAKLRLGAVGIAHYFDLILGDGGGLTKGPEHMEAIRKHLGEDNFERSAVYVGDGPADMRFATEARIIPIGITHTVQRQRLEDAGALRVIDSLDELPPLLAELDVA
ncbi:MAG: HAD family hydrolase [Candidatus Aenigmatarchaeota archaeon]|nr:MAG: HAD family hydrolase [Candidatus Aenigmarchaeota archaeon]